MKAEKFSASVARFKTAVTHLPAAHLIFLALIGFLIILYLALGFERPPILFVSPFQGALFFLLLFSLLTFLWGVLSLNFTGCPVFYPTIILSPFFLLLLVLPYFYFPTQSHHISVPTIFALIILCSASFFLSLKEREHRNVPASGFSAQIFLVFFALCYAGIFGAVGILQYENYQSFNAPDLALYNQILWNNLHGHFFESSVSGSNFATHNSPFLILLTPLYAIFPSVQMLLMLKTFFLAFCAIPFYFINNHILRGKGALALTAGFMFYPFLIAQNFSAPHEICFLPPLLLFSFYFFLTKRFWPFVVFLLLSVSVKEHVGLIAIAYGLYAAMQKKAARWVWMPLITGILWSILSLAVIHHFVKLYSTDPHPAWFITDLKERFLSETAPLWPNLAAGLKTANIGSPFKLVFCYQLFSPLLVVLPFLSPVFLLGAPEFVINLLSDRLIFFPVWHYNIIVSCFLLAACTLSIQKLSESRFFINLCGHPDTAKKLLSWAVFFSIMIHHILWIDLARVEKRPLYAATAKEALSLIEPTASVSAPKNIVSHVSGRREYFLLSDCRRGDYILTDDAKTADGFLKQADDKTSYRKIFDKNGIFLLRRNPP